VTSTKDPATERTELTRSIDRLEKQLTAARDEARLANEELVAAQTRLQGAQEAHGAADLERIAAHTVVDAALAEHGFTSADPLMKAIRTGTQIAALDRQVREFEQLQASTRDRLVELEPQIVGREVDAASLATAEHSDISAQQTFEAAVAAVSRLEEQLQRLKKDAEQAQRLIAERNTVARTFATTGEMAGDLRNDRFQEYLLEEAFKGLVAGASARLRNMSRRYTMEWLDSEFYVLDHDNAGERRRAETLSGGETFMASLCLALQLSDEVLQASGAIRMDSLFIDEGFGSLDAQSLSEVTDALENLQQGGDRVVGIISHIPELSARLPGCIRVEKGLGESTWAVERVG
jgi:exonuclease SbcC